MTRVASAAVPVPFSSDRGPGAPDDNEIIQVGLPRPLMASGR